MGTEASLDMFQRSCDSVRSFHTNFTGMSMSWAGLQEFCDGNIALQQCSYSHEKMVWMILSLITMQPCTMLSIPHWGEVGFTCGKLESD